MPRVCPFAFIGWDHSGPFRGLVGLACRMEIDEEGRVSKAQEEEQEEIRRKLQENLTGTVREEEAAGAGPKGEQQEFYTKDEMFSKKRAKKGKKKSKNLRQGKLTADELERIAEEEGGPGKSSDLAQRDTAAQRQVRHPPPLALLPASPPMI